MPGRHLHEHCGWTFWRFDFSATLGNQPRSLAYSLAMGGCDPAHRWGVIAHALRPPTDACKPPAVRQPHAASLTGWMSGLWARAASMQTN